MTIVLARPGRVLRAGAAHTAPHDRRAVFANRGFSAASAALTVTFFALFGSLFVLTQYLQLVHGCSTLAAGVRALPFALAMGAVSPR